MESSLNFRPLTFHLTKKFPFSWPHPQKCRCQDRRSCWQCHCTSSPSGSACTWSCANWLWPEKHAAMPPRMWRNMGNTGRIYLNILMRPDWGDVSLFRNRALIVQDLQPFQIGCLWIHWFITIFLIQIATLRVCRYAPFSDTPSSSWMTPAWNNTIINLCSSQLSHKLDIEWHSMISTRCRSYCPHPKKEKNLTQTEGHSFRNRLNSLRTLQAFCLFSSWQPSLQVKARRTWVWVKIWDMDSARNWVGFKYSTSSWGDLHATREAASSRGQRPTRKRSPIPEQQIILIPSVKKKHQNSTISYSSLSLSLSLSRSLSSWNPQIMCPCFHFLDPPQKKQLGLKHWTEKYHPTEFSKPQTVKEYPPKVQTPLFPQKKCPVP